MRKPGDPGAPTMLLVQTTSDMIEKTALTRKWTVEKDLYLVSGHTLTGHIHAYIDKDGGFKYVRVFEERENWGDIYSGNVQITN